MERSGVLSLRWDHATAVGTANDMVFDLRLPMAIQRQLQITTSTNVELTCESGLVSSREIPGPEMGRLWTIQLDGRPLTRLGIRKIQPGPGAAPPFIVREATNCAVVGSSVDFETTFALDVLQAPLGQLELRVDSTVQVTDVRIAERTVPFRR